MYAINLKLIYQTSFLLILFSLTILVRAETLNRGFAAPLLINNLDPHRNSSDTIYAVIAHYLAPLLNVDEEGNLLPSLAKSWKISNDSKRITLILRDNLVWSDGTPLTALQAQKSIERALSDVALSDATPLLMPIAGAKEHLQYRNHETPLGVIALSDTVLQFDLVLPNPTFLKVLTHPISSPIPIHQINAKNEYPIKENIASSGPYSVVKRNQSQVFFEVNEKYFSKKPAYNKVSFTFGQYGELVRDFLKGDMQILDWVSAEDAKWFKKKNANVVVSNKTLGATYLLFNGLFIEDEVRSILYRSINANDIKEKINDAEKFFPIQRIVDWDKDDFSKPISEFDMVASRIRMEKKGYTAESPLSLCINILNTPLNMKIFNYLKSYWAAVNINLTFNDQLEDEVSNTACEIVYDGYAPRLKSSEEVISAFFMANRYINGIGSIEELNSLYQDLLLEKDLLERKKKVLLIERELLNRNLVKPINTVEFLSLVAESVGGFEKARKKRNDFITLSQFLYPKKSVKDSY